MFIWEMPSVENQPTVTLIRWRVLRLTHQGMSIDLVLGWCVEDAHARMSTPIIVIDHDAEVRTLTTKSGRAYVLAGPCGYDDDAQYILEQKFGSLAPIAIDVSAEYFNEPLKWLDDKNCAPN